AAGGATTCSASPAGGAGDDCDDTRANVHPGLTETCDNLDNDCTGPLDAVELDCDDDNDGFCDSAFPKAGGVSVTTCTSTAAAATVGDDCVDTDNTIKPGQTEICDNKDNDCTGPLDAVENDCD